MSQARLDLDAEISSGEYRKAASRLQHSLTALCDSGNWTNAIKRARLLEEHRTLAAGLCAACDFSTAFERSFEIRAGLLDAGVAVWCVESLGRIAWASVNVSAVAAAIRHLAASFDGRNTVGQIGGVAALHAAWRKQPTCIDVIEALTVLCTGHIDNISRFLREDGVNFAVQMFELHSTKSEGGASKDYKGSPSSVVPQQITGEDNNDERLMSSLMAPVELISYEGSPPLIDSQVLIEVLKLVGVCCVCLPDEGKGDNLVPSLTELLKYACVNPRYGRPVAVAALEIFGNIGEAWFREQLLYDNACRPNLSSPVSTANPSRCANAIPGYTIRSSSMIAEVILAAWQRWPADRETVAAATWALCSLHCSSKVVLHGTSSAIVPSEVVSDITQQLVHCTVETGTVRALKEILHVDNDQTQSRNRKHRAHKRQGNRVRAGGRVCKKTATQRIKA